MWDGELIDRIHKKKNREIRGMAMIATIKPHNLHHTNEYLEGSPVRRFVTFAHYSSLKHFSLCESIIHGPSRPIQTKSRRWKLKVHVLRAISNLLNKKIQQTWKSEQKHMKESQNFVMKMNSRKISTSTGWAQSRNLHLIRYSRSIAGEENQNEIHDFLNIKK